MKGNDCKPQSQPFAANSVYLFQWLLPSIISDAVSEQAHRECSQYASQVQRLFDRLAAESAIKDSEPAISTSGSATDENARLEKCRIELETEQKAVTEAAMRLGKEKAELDVSTDSVIDVGGSSYCLGEAHQAHRGETILAGPKGDF